MHNLSVQHANGDVVPVVDNELAAAIRASTHQETLMRLGEYKALVNRARSGRATTKQDQYTQYDLQGIGLDPRLWELRLEVDGWLLRQYHAEPPSHPTLLVAVKAHAKKIFTDDGGATIEAQDSEIVQGARRYDDERHRDWGWQGTS